jgi:hypothetical protein
MKIICQASKVESLLYRAIGLVLDFIHRLVCGRQKIPQRTTYTIVRILSSLSESLLFIVNGNGTDYKDYYKRKM